MTAHRPHPIVGPWPYAHRPSGPREFGDPLRLIEQAPVDTSLIYDDPDDAVLYDGCKRCAQHAEHPLNSLDDDRLRPLLQAALAPLSDPIPKQPTDTQQRACQVLRDQYLAANDRLQRVHALTGSLPVWMYGATASVGREVEDIETVLGADEEG